MDKYGLAIYNENRVKKRLSTYLDCGGLASVIFPTMKTLGGSDGAKKVEKAASAEVKTEAKPAERIDFSNVKIEPLFEEMVDFETFAKSDYRAVKIKDCAPVPKSKKLLQFTLDDGSGTDARF